MRLANLTWPKAQEYFEKNDMVLISIGSIECHGRHMPLGTDTLIPDFLLEKIEQKSDVLIAPTIPYGACQSLAPYPGTIDIDNEVLYQFCRQIFLSLYRHGARKFVFLNGHGGNMKMIERLGLEFEDKGCLVAMLNWWLMAWDMNPAWKGGHGGGEFRRDHAGLHGGVQILRVDFKDLVQSRRQNDDGVGTVRDGAAGKVRARTANGHGDAFLVAAFHHLPELFHLGGAHHEAGDHGLQNRRVIRVTLAIRLAAEDVFLADKLFKFLYERSARH